MDGLHIFLVVLLGTCNCVNVKPCNTGHISICFYNCVCITRVVSCSHDSISGSMLEATVRPGDNITLYCDCKSSSEVRIVWYRNCSHENQPSLVLRVNKDYFETMRIFPRFQYVRNFSSVSYDLLIMNITESDEGLYYCGTERTRVEDETCITSRDVYRYGNVTTKIKFESSETHLNETQRDCGVCWSLLYSLCPASAVLSSLLSSLLVYHLCQKKAKEPPADQQRPHTRLNQDEDVCYAALEIRPASQRPKKKKTQSSDFSTYSAINTSRM